ncbi:MAG: hypothetical protein H6686_06710 [Fibrobacteria bacterium]|nr:hypothetical protein [Fibrobacteria bacterium]
MSSQDQTPTLSVIVYGRNDGHGYNLARRAATSLNAIAHVLREEDEILFVDANGADTFPTFPESISDTLTPKARQVLRVIRVRPGSYRRWTSQARLPVHEPFCRNVALRRVAPSCKWVLSTNTDIVPVIEGGKTIGELLEGLDPGFLHIAPRIELPERMWESLDRREPDSAIASCRRWATSQHLGVVVQADPIVVHDGPGDFQLVPLDLARRLDGFDESILGGWHVDGNFCARSRLATGRNISLAGKVAAWHLDHNRQATTIHRNRHGSETPEQLITGVRECGLPAQREHWGADGVEFEEIRLPEPGGFRFGGEDLLPTSPATPVVQQMHAEAFNHGCAVDSPLVFPHLASHLDTWGAGTRVAYLGSSPTMIELLERFVLEHSMELVVAPGLLAERGGADFVARAATSQVLVVDAWSADLWTPGEPKDLRKSDGALGRRCRAIDEQLRTIHRRVLRERRNNLLVLFVSCQHTWLDLDVHRFFDITLTPWASRVRPARVRPVESELRSFLRRKWSRRIR